jgi:hypothetical protein
MRKTRSRPVNRSREAEIFRRRDNAALAGSIAALAAEYVAPEGTVLMVARDLYSSLDTEFSRKCEFLLRSNQLEKLVRLEVDARAYSNARDYELDRQAADFLRKCPLEIEGVDPEAAAREKFRDAELLCAQTNARFRRDPNGANAPPEVRQALGLSMGFIQDVLGTRVNPREWVESCRFGPGAFNGAYPGLTSVYDKLQVRPGVTKDFLAPGAMLCSSSPSWAASVTDDETEGFHPFVSESHMDVVAGNRITFVPKTATTHRTIAIEPLVNVYAQLGLGRMIRRRLKSFAYIDLDDQEPNQLLAREGSIRGFLATVDLSSASDTVARNVVRALLPEAWFTCLDSCRSKVGKLDGEWLYYEKFSSMGNGFTFELETLVFWALARSACVIAGEPEMVSVYGDDIILPCAAYETLAGLLEYFGFQVNTRKTFTSGPFRESCGTDWYEGKNVRPFFQKEVPKDLHEVFALANALSARARDLGTGFGRASILHRAWRTAIERVPRVIRENLVVPAHADDHSGLKVTWDEAAKSPFVVRKRGWWAWWTLGLSLEPDQPALPGNFLGGRASLLYRAKDGFGADYRPAPPRLGRDTHQVVKELIFPDEWSDYGPWIGA